jgi:hypothetical protein
MIPFLICAGTEAGTVFPQETKTSEQRIAANNALFITIYL